MKIKLCENTKNVEKIEKFLDRNLRKVDIEIKGCIGMCKNCEKHVVAKVDGKEIIADSAYGLLKEIRKILKKEDKLDLLRDEELKDAKKEHKAEKSDKDKDKDKDKARQKDKGKDKGKEKGKDKVDNLALEDSVDEAPELYEEEIEAKIVGDQIVLTVPSAEFSLDHMKISLNFGSFGDQNSTYEIVRAKPTADEAAQAVQAKKEAERASVMTFKAPELLGETKEKDR